MGPAEHGAIRARSTKRRGRVLFVGLVVGLLSILLGSCNSTSSASPNTTTRAATSTGPHGWKTYVYEQVAISVPSDWKVITNYVCPEAQSPGTLFLGPSKDPDVFCPEYPLDVDSVTVTSVPEAALPPPQVTCAPISVHGLEVDVEPCSSSDASGDTTWLVSALGIEAQATQGGGSSVGGGTATVVGKVLHTLREASAQEVIASSPVDWPTYTYRSAAISVPSSWSVRRDQDCPDPSAEGTLELGRPTVDSTCTALADPTVGVTLSSLTPDVNYGSCSTFRVNELRAYVADCKTRHPEGDTNWAVPALGLDVSAGPDSSALVSLILHTIRHATPRDITASAPLSLRITLQHTRVAAGLPIKGTAVFTNRSGDPITVEACAADRWLNVGLANKHISYQPANVAIACPPTVQLATGVTRMPITVATTFQGCAQSSSSPTAPEFPTSCPGGPAPLPAGTYYTVVITSGLPADMPSANVVKVTLTHDPTLRG